MINSENRAKKIGLFSHLVRFQLIDFIRNQQILNIIIFQPLLQINVGFHRFVAGIDDMNDKSVRFFLIDPVIQQFVPVFFNFRGDSGESITRCVNEVELVVNQEVIQALRFSGRLADFCDLL